VRPEIEDRHCGAATATCGIRLFAAENLSSAARLTAPDTMRAADRLTLCSVCGRERLG
jgi:hypothetical protein